MRNADGLSREVVTGGNQSDGQGCARGEFSAVALILAAQGKLTASDPAAHQVDGVWKPFGIASEMIE